MSRGSGYANGYADPVRYEPSDGRHGSNPNLAINGFPGGGGRERRAGGYGGFYSGPSEQPSLSPSASPEPPRDRWDRDRRDPSTSRSRTRDVDPDGRLQPSQDARFRGDTGLSPSRSRERARSAGNAVRKSQAIEGLIVPRPVLELAPITADWLLWLMCV